MNPVTLARLGANISLILVVLAFLAAMYLGSGKVSDGWAWIIGGVALAGAVGQIVASVIWPKSVGPAWDEQVIETQRTANSFGFFITLAMFLVFLILVINDMMRPDLAFYLMGAPLGIAPAIWMIVAHLQGRAG